MTKILKTTNHLTGAELHRLLHRYDLKPEVARAIWEDDWYEADYLAEIAAEHRAEGRRSRSYQTRLQAFFATHPLHTCQTAEEAGVAGLGVDEDELPF